MNITVSEISFLCFIMILLNDEILSVIITCMIEYI